MGDIPVFSSNSGLYKHAISLYRLVVKFKVRRYLHKSLYLGNEGKR